MKQSEIQGYTCICFAVPITSLRDLFKAVDPSPSSEDLTIDRIHRVSKLSFLLQEIPRDVLMWIHYYKAKERILAAFCKKNYLPEQATSLQVLPDLPAHTLQHCKILAITKALRKHDISCNIEDHS